MAKLYVTADDEQKTIKVDIEGTEAQLRGMLRAAIDFIGSSVGLSDEEEKALSLFQKD